MFAGAGVFGDVGRLEQAGDYRNPARACSDDLPKIVGLNSANTKDRENHIAMDALNLLQSNRLIIGFGRRRENRAEPNVISASASRGHGLMDAVSRRSNPNST